MAKYTIATTKRPAADLIAMVGIPSLTVLRVMLDTKSGDTPVASFKSALSAMNFKRLSTHIHRLRKLVGADILPVRDGKSVVAYKLTNAGMFVNVTADSLVKKPKAAKPAKAPKVAKTKVVTKPVVAPKMPKPVAKAATKKVAKVETPVVPMDNVPEVLPLSSAAVDSDFDAFDSTDLPGFLK